MTTPQDRARIEAEEAYRAELRGKRRKGTLAKWGCGLLALPLLALIGVMFLGSLSRTLSSGDPSPDRQTEFVVNCERQLKAALKAPATAQISNAFSDGVLTTASGYAWNGTVDAENSFGANIRTAFRCSGPPDTPTVTLN